MYRYTKERIINELRHNSMYGYENNRYISKRNMELFEDRVQPCHWKGLGVKRLDGFVLYIQG